MVMMTAKVNKKRVILVLAALAGGLLCWAKKLQDRRHKPLVETFHNR